MARVRAARIRPADRLAALQGMTMDANELEGRVALVTGASRNIGRAIALALAAGGAAVAVNARRSIDEAQAVVKEIESRGGRALAGPADAARERALGARGGAAAARLGRLRI